MARIVQKFGGTSVATIEHIQCAADVVARRRAAGDDVVVAVSAMGETTDELAGLARQIAARPSRRAVRTRGEPRRTRADIDPGGSPR